MYPRYFKHFTDKHGFADGEEQPGDAYDERTVFCRLFNARALVTDVDIVAMAFDRPGVHNNCLILFAPLCTLQKLGITDPVNSDGVTDQIWRNKKMVDGDLVPADSKEVTRIRRWLDRNVDTTVILTYGSHIDTAVLAQTLKRIGDI
jgi:hypothetical protein